MSEWKVRTVVPITVTMEGDKENYRYCLTGNEDAKNPLIVLGLNPSTANEEKPDPTMKKVVSFMELNDFDGFKMLNLYSKRTPYPKKLKSIGINPKEHKKNLESIKKHIELLNEPTILLAFGANIVEIDGLVDCFKEIVKECKAYNPKWRCLDTTKDGHPKHPLYLSKNLRLREFDVDEYLKKL
ncbi:MAG: DUF1643 domain-containing protein [Spirochaetaceae bacterium]|nr:DUF1643 domain-containing protein [Spirochaetaceae bacterium]